MTLLIARIKVLATEATTWLLVLMGALIELSDKLNKIVGLDPAIVGGITKAVVLIGTAVAIIRRVTEVIDSQKGLLPVGGLVVPKTNMPALGAPGDVPANLDKGTIAFPDVVWFLVAIAVLLAIVLMWRQVTGK